MLIKGFLILSDNCDKLFWEMEKYATDDNGKIPKEDDHAIDALRYLLNAANYHQVPQNEPETEIQLFPDRKGFRLHNDYSMKEEDLNGINDDDFFHS